MFGIMLFFVPQSFPLEKGSGGDTYFISGTAVDSHKEPVRGARIKIFVNGQLQKVMAGHTLADETETSSQGTYRAEFRLPPGQIENADIRLEVYKTSYR